MRTALFLAIMLLSATTIFGQYSPIKIPKEWARDLVIKVSHTGSMSGGSSHLTITYDSSIQIIDPPHGQTERRAFALTQKDRDAILAKMRELKVDHIKPNVKLGTQNDGWSTLLCIANHCIEGGSESDMSEKDDGRFADAYSYLEGYTPETHAQEWSNVGAGIQSQFKDEHNNVYDLKVYKDILYAVGSFTEAGGQPAKYIAQWDGNEWKPVAEGMNAMVSSLCIYKDELYAGGWFTMAGSTEANYIAKWNGTTWEALGSGLNSHPNDMIVYKDELYVAGEFTTAGGNAAGNVAKWNGTSWSPVGKGVDVVRTLGVYKNVLYTGGWAFKKGTQGINQWDGTKWSKAKFDVTGVPTSMLVYKDELYVGGYFPAGEKKEENCLSQFNGTRLLKTGKAGTNGDVDALLIYNDILYTAGFFNEVEGIPASNIAKWNGDLWKPFAPGVDFHPKALVIYKDHLYAAGGYNPSGSGTIGKSLIAKISLSVLE